MACTAIHLPLADDSAFVYGRTLDYPYPLDSSLLVFPRGHVFTGTAPGGSLGHRWISQFGFVGLNQNALIPEMRTIISEGINEKGLIVSALYLPHYARYQSFDETRRASTIACWDVVAFLLGMAETIEEASAMLRSVVVAQQDLPVPSTKINPTLHYSIADAHGGQLVVEYVEGRLHIYDNRRIGVLTNSPPFPWQLDNLARYQTLQPKNPISASEINPVARMILPRDYPIMTIGNGTGMLGLPGDFSSPSRFVRAALFRRFTQRPTSAAEAEALLWTIMGHFIIFPSIVREYSDQIVTTQWTVVYNSAARTMAVRTTSTPLPQILHLDHLNFSLPHLQQIELRT